MGLVQMGLVQLGVVQFGVVQLGVVQLGSVQMGADRPMASTATFKFGLQISKSHGPAKGEGVRGLRSQGLLKGTFFCYLPLTIEKVVRTAAT